MFTTAKNEHRAEEDVTQKAILELQAKKAAIDNGEFWHVCQDGVDEWDSISLYHNSMSITC